MTSVRTTNSDKHLRPRTEDMKYEALLRGRPVGFMLSIIHEEIDEQAELEVPNGIPEVPPGIIYEEQQAVFESSFAEEPLERDWTGLNQGMRWWCPWNAHSRESAVQYNENFTEVFFS